MYSLLQILRMDTVECQSLGGVMRIWFDDICDEIIHHGPLTALSHGRTRHLTPEQRNRKGTNDVEVESRAIESNQRGKSRGSIVEWGF